jgi:hypothetical protein
MGHRETSVWEVIAQQLAGLYRELAERQPFSAVARVELSAAASSGRATRLLICQCDTDGLELLSFFRRWWIVDAAGLHADVEWPLSQALVDHEGWEAEIPVVKFATDGKRVRFGMMVEWRNWIVSDIGRRSKIHVEDKTITCIDCKKDFTHGVEDQRRHLALGYSQEPKRCLECRTARKDRAAARKANSRPSQEVGATGDFAAPHREKREKRGSRGNQRQSRGGFGGSWSSQERSERPGGFGGGFGVGPGGGFSSGPRAPPGARRRRSRTNRSPPRSGARTSGRTRARPGSAGGRFR